MTGNPTFKAINDWRIMFVCIIALTLYLFQSPLSWFWSQLVIDSFNGLLLLMLPVIWHFRTQQMIQLTSLTFSLYPVILFWLFIVTYLLNENYLGIHIFSAVTFLGAIYSLLGLILSKRQWRSLFIPFCLLVLVLPFQGYLDVYLGFPLRLLSAESAGQVLQTLGYSSFTHESIILIEEKAANVDLGCSGIKGIWAGAIFFLLLSIIEAHRVTWLWLLTGFVFIGCLLLANILRIVLLVLLGVVADFSELADLVHQCLGLLGFSISCVIAWLLLGLKRQAIQTDTFIDTTDMDGSEKTSLSKIKYNKFKLNKIRYNKINLFKCNLEKIGAIHGKHKKSSFAAASSLFIGFLCLSLLLHQPLLPVEINIPVKLSLPTDLNSSTIELTDVEKTFFTNNQASVSKLRFNFEGYSGSLLVVNSFYWKAQHEPHNCYIGQGFSLGYEGLWLLTNNNAVRFIQINNQLKTAIYWFQSTEKITPDYSARIISGVLEPEQSWLMVSVLLDQPVEQRHIEKLLLKIQASMTAQLTSGDNNA